MYHKVTDEDKERKHIGEGKRNDGKNLNGGGEEKKKCMVGIVSSPSLALPSIVNRDRIIQQ